MHVIRDIVGASLSAFFTGFLFLGPAVLGAIYALAPRDMVQTLVMDEPRPVYFDGAYELAEVEIDGDLDGTSEAEGTEEEEEPSEPEETPEPAGDEDGTESKDAPEVDSKQGADILGDPSSAVAKTGSTVGSKVGGRAVQGKTTSGRRKKRSRQICPKSYEGVTRREDGVYVIERQLVLYHTSSLDHFNQLGWSRANKEGKGWVISGFDCQGALWHGGMRRGDVVLSVNGKRTNNMLQVLRLYPKLRNHRAFEVEILRKGRPLVLRYEIAG